MESRPQSSPRHLYLDAADGPMAEGVLSTKLSVIMDGARHLMHCGSAFLMQQRSRDDGDPPSIRAHARTPITPARMASELL